jgi:hypothetical protein
VASRLLLAHVIAVRNMKYTYRNKNPNAKWVCMLLLAVLVVTALPRDLATRARHEGAHRKLERGTS